MIKYVKGDLFENLPTKMDSHTLLAHIVNNQGVMGAGFVVPLKKKWPKVAEEYYKNKQLKLGETLFVTVDHDKIDWRDGSLVVCNMCAQTLGEKRPLKYAALISCMKYVQRFALINAAFKPTKIIAPMFGSCRAGGTWAFIEELIEEIWLSAGIPVTIYKLED